MTPIQIIQQAAADGVVLRRSPAGTIKARGEQAAVERWLPVIRENKPGILVALEQTQDDPPLPDPVAEARLQRVIAMLDARPGIRYAVLANTEVDPGVVIITLAIRGKAACELHVPRDKYDGVLLLDLIERHGATVH